MPKTKPAQIKPRGEPGGRLGRHRRRRRGQGRAAGGRRVPARPQAVQAARREGAQGRPAARAARHRQDAAGQGRRPRVRRAVLLAVGVLVRRDVRRPRRRAHPPPVPRGAQARARDHLHRRARRRRRAPRHRQQLGEREQTLNQLLVEMDGFASSGDRSSSWPPPTCSRSSTRRCCARAASTARSSSRRPTSTAASRSSRSTRANKPLREDVDLHLVAQQTSGLTGADLANICNEAAIFCARREGHAIGAPGLRRRARARHRRRAVQHDAQRPRAPRRRLPRGRPRAVPRAAGPVDRVHKISIVPRGQALGYVMNLPDEDSYLKTREELIDQMTVLLGGRVAEQIVFGAVTTGAANDLQRVAEITHAMVHEYGDGLGPDAPRVDRRAKVVSDLTRRIRDEEQQELAFEAQRTRVRAHHRPPRDARRARPGAAGERGARARRDRPHHGRRPAPRAPPPGRRPADRGLDALPPAPSTPEPPEPASH